MRKLEVQQHAISFGFEFEKEIWQKYDKGTGVIIYHARDNEEWENKLLNHSKAIAEYYSCTLLKSNNTTSGKRGKKSSKKGVCASTLQKPFCVDKYNSLVFGGEKNNVCGSIMFFYGPVSAMVSAKTSTRRLDIRHVVVNVYAHRVLHR